MEHECVWYTRAALRRRAGAVTGAGGIETVGGAEIAAAIDRRGCFRGFRYRLLSIARKGAVSCFLFQYLLFFEAGFAWALALGACALAVELRANRFAMTTYSTREIVDLLLQRASLDGTRRHAAKRIVPGVLLCLAGLAGCIAGVSFYLCHAAMFAGALWMLCALKWADMVGKAKNALFEYVEAGNGGVHLRCPRGVPNWQILRPWEDPVAAAARLSLLYAGFAIVAVFAATADVRSLQGPEHMVTLALLVFPLAGCTLHESVRFHLVDRELERLREDAARDPEGWAGAVRRADREESLIAGLGR